jgi:hypothetical protein
MFNMLEKRRLPPGFLVPLVLFVVAFLLGGCASTRDQEEMLRQNEILQQENSQLATTLAERNAETFKLQMELVEKQAEINRIKVTQENLTKKIEQNKVRRPTPGTKVEAVTYLAEVATDIDTARESASAGEGRVLAQAEGLITEGKTELERGNFDKVHALATKALELVEEIRGKTSRNRGAINSAISDFLAPQQLQLAKSANVRTSPGMDGLILTALAAKTAVIATGHQGNWIKVTLGDRQTGWIYYTLLVVPETNLPFPSPVK